MSGRREEMRLYQSPHVILPAAGGLEVKVGVFGRLGAAGKGGRDEEPKSQEKTPGEEECQRRLILDSFL